MKAVVLHEYGSASNLKYEDFAEPKPGEGEVLVRVSAASVNPVDWKMRSGVVKEMFPVEFPGVLGRDVSGVVRELGEGVTGFAAGDRVMALASHTYAELCVVKASDLTKVPEGLDMNTAAAIPLVALTGDQLIRLACKVKAGETVVITGALGSVGRCAVFCAHEIGAKVIAGVRGKQIDEAKALPGVVDAIAIDDNASMAKLGIADSVADTVGGDVASHLLGKVKQGGTYGSLVGPPKDAALHPTIEVNAMGAHPDAATVLHYAEAVRDKKLMLPIEELLPLAKAAEAHKIGEKGGVGKLVLIA